MQSVSPSASIHTDRHVVALSGGIGGAKLALGLYLTLAPDRLTVVCNPGDDFEHLGLTVCPDFDTVLYTLSGLANPVLGWGRQGETWSFMNALRRLGGEDWFNLGDGDLALHVERSRRLQAGESPTAVANALSLALDVSADLLPVSDEPVRTIVQTEEMGALPFQRYFVQHRCVPTVTGFDFEGAAQAALTEEVTAVLSRPDLHAIVICPSNPFISIDPILAVPGMREALRSSAAPVIAVSPLIGGQSIKGPTAKMMRELGMPGSNETLVSHYGDVVDGWIIDESDAAEAQMLETPCTVAATLMTDERSKMALARDCLQFAAQLTG